MLAFKYSLSNVSVQLWPVDSQLIHLIVILTKSFAVPAPPPPIPRKGFNSRGSTVARVVYLQM